MRTRRRLIKRNSPSRLAAPLTVGALFALMLVLLVVLRGMPAGLLGIYGFFSTLAFLAYGADKSAAREGRRRTPEASLHLLALLGGWPGAFLAQRVYHHKTRKASFLLVFWSTVGLNCGLLLLLASAVTTPPA